jgi:hypothetical protein
MMNDGKCAGGIEIGVGPCPRCGATDNDVCPVAAQNDLRHSSAERESLYKMLEVYWANGDGNPPPAFIKDAAKLCGYPLQPA